MLGCQLPNQGWTRDLNPRNQHEVVMGCHRQDESARLSLLEIFCSRFRTPGESPRSYVPSWGRSSPPGVARARHFNRPSRWPTPGAKEGLSGKSWEGRLRGKNTIVNSKRYPIIGFKGTAGCWEDAMMTVRGQGEFWLARASLPGVHRERMRWDEGGGREDGQEIEVGGHANGNAAYRVFLCPMDFMTFQDKHRHYQSLF